MTLIPPIQTRSLAFYRRPLRDFDRWASGLPLPPSLAGRHLDARLREWVASFARSVFVDLYHGIEIQDSRAGRRIFLLKTFDIYIRADLRQIRSVLYWPNGERRDIKLAIGSMFGVDRWMSEWLLHRAVNLASLHSSMEAHALAYPTAHATQGQWLAQALGDTWTWACDAVIRLLKRKLDIPLMRHAMRDAIGADRELLALARTARYGYGGTYDVTCDWYNLCVLHRYQVERVSQKASGLLPYLGALMRNERIEPEQPPFAVMRQNLLAAGATAADWRFLMRNQARPVWKYVRETRMTAKIDRLLCSWAACHR
ncbi:MAG TPA: hypothetical protein VNM48_14120, partial [Chloroflexota bacterium]|nr:hypothetical protein [Chloroflexota bacterium]